MPHYDFLRDRLVDAAMNDLKGFFDVSAHTLFSEVYSLGGGEAGKMRALMPKLQGWVLGDRVYGYNGAKYALVCWDGCLRRWMLMRLEDDKFIRFK